MLFPWGLQCLNLSHKCLCELWLLISWQLVLRSKGIPGTGRGCFLTAVTFRGKKAHTWGWPGQSQNSFPLCFAPRECVYCSCPTVPWRAGIWKLNIIFIKITREKGRRDPILSSQGIIGFAQWLGAQGWDMATCQEVLWLCIWFRICQACIFFEHLRFEVSIRHPSGEVLKIHAWQIRNQKSTSWHAAMSLCLLSLF